METAATQEYSKPLLHEGIYAGDYFFDRQEIEAEARLLIQQREYLPRVEVKKPERLNNARTALWEAMTASGHLSRVEISGSLEEINAQILNRLVNGWDDDLPIHEKQRRFAELTNELFIQKIHSLIAQGQLPSDAIFNEISDYPFAMDDDTAVSLGYRPSNHKGIPRSHYLFYEGDGTHTRVIESVSRGNSNWLSTFGFLNDAGVQVETDKPADIAALETPFICSQSDYRDGVVDIVRLLDQHSGQGILYGDQGERTKRHIPYENLRMESIRREEEVEFHVEDLAELEEQLDQMYAAGQISKNEKIELFKGEVSRILDVICTMRPQYAEDTFGKAAAPAFYAASDRAAAGDHTAAVAILKEAELLKQTVTFCGMSISVEQAQQMGIKVNTFPELLAKSRKNWKWEKGYCRNPFGDCDSKNKRILIGPCSICTKCQARYDQPDKTDPFEVIASDFRRIKRAVELKRKIKEQEDLQKAA